MKRIVTHHRKALLVFAALLCAAASARAESPHFVGKVTATLTSDDNALVCWKEAGLDDNLLINNTASADSASTFVCVNGGGQCPNAANKTTVSGPVSATGAFSSGKNGNIVACLTISPPGPGSFACPPGQVLTRSDVSFSNLRDSDDTDGISATASPSAFSATLFTCPGP